jgi:hypothetical protein
MSGANLGINDRVAAGYLRQFFIPTPGAKGVSTRLRLRLGAENGASDRPCATAIICCMQVLFSPPVASRFSSVLTRLLFVSR